MHRPAKKISIDEQLKKFYKVCCYFGLINFKFNPVKNTFEFSKRLSSISSVVYTLLTVIFGGIALIMVLTAFLSYVNVISTRFELSPIKTQEDLLQKMEVFCHYVTGVLIGVHFRRLRSVVLPVTKKLHAILSSLESERGATVYTEHGFHRVLLLKIWLNFITAVNCIIYLVVMTCSCVFLIRKATSSQLVVSYLYLMVITVILCYVHLTFALMHLSHVYAQLTLICIYSQMTEVLGACGAQPSRQLMKVVRKVFRISSEIHRLKKDLDKFYTACYLMSYLKAIAQVQNLYGVLKLILYGKQRISRTMLIAALACKLPVFVSHWCDIYLIGRLSDMLLEAHRHFRDSVWSVIVARDLFRKKSVEEKMELELFQAHVYRLDTRIFGMKRIDQRFAFDYLMNVIMAFGISFLQYYAREEFYKPNNPIEMSSTESSY